MIRVAVVGLGKMGMSHLSIIRALAGVEVAAICDSSGIVLEVLGKYTGLKTYTDLEKMLQAENLDAVVIATPTRLHASMVRKALEHGVAVFCEKPFSLSSAESIELAALATSKGLVSQVGYHNRFVGTFAEVKRLLDAGAIGTVTHSLAEAYGPVVLKPQGGTWRSQRSEGGGCLYDYAAHPLNLINWYLGEPESVAGSVLNSVFSREIDDEVSSTLKFANGSTTQVSVNWCDESVRKMTTRITLWGTKGRIFADRQEIQVYLRDEAPSIAGYRPGWNVKYTTELTEPVSFYLRGEEYTAQLESFVARVTSGQVDGANDFASAALTDCLIERMRADADGLPSHGDTGTTVRPATRRRTGPRGLIDAIRGR